MGMASNRSLLPVAAARFTAAVRAVPRNRWNDPTPCAEWSVRDVVNHMTAEHLWVPHLLGGQTLAEVGDRYDGDNLGADPVAAWESAVTASLAAWQALPTDEEPVHLSFGLVPASLYASQMLVDLSVHCWDVARGAGLDERLVPEAVSAVLAFLEPQGSALAESGYFAAAVATSSADIQDRVLALSGRDPT
ncbi:MAG: TIGR03086 family metal-binding protein [Oryzihumus sp.]